MTELETTLSDLDNWTQTFDTVTADARVSLGAEHDVALAVQYGREAWKRYVAAAGGKPDPDVRDRTPAAFFRE
ncbi:hypothetical protein CCAX7_36310 [Capsulimonas corticalis]|uniref:Uncharacterized protein n=1 Tax=Capsulimonas corticalis TaxID=2219043 RepID=A0A402D6V8_9BACT|nr:hypothetical protein [Capsulimonas corticalis]BDI31580.1 hypothetical protein CCAX7_36310 [Capsulimonas corticalis]